MKLHLLTVGAPKLAYAKAGLEEYGARLQRNPKHHWRVTHVADKDAQNTQRLLQIAGDAYKIALAIEGQQFSSEELAAWLDGRALSGRELCFMIGGPHGLPDEVVAAADFQLSLSRLTLPHDLAMVIAAEALYRALSLNEGHPYHK
jgi:23S rRNA (pseudouridine1915-N3)-methyltransferase